MIKNMSYFYLLISSFQANLTHFGQNAILV